MKKPQMILLGGGAVSAVLVVLAAVFTVTSLSKADADKKKVNREFSSLENLYRTANPFPTHENIEIARKNQEETLGRVESLQALLAQGVSDEDEKLTPGQFSQLREEMIRALVKDAPAGEGGLPVVEPENVFGFDRYNEGQPASKAQVPRLVRQLRLTDLLVRKFYAAGILRLDAVGREVFEEADGASAAAASESAGGGFARRRHGASKAAATANKKVTSIKVPLAPFTPEHGIAIDRQRFGFVFTTREAGLRNVLDSLDGMWPYVMISGFSFQKTQPDFVFPDEEDPAAKAKLPEKKPEVSATPGVKEKPAPRTARLVSGPQFEAPVTVTMFVDVYRFPPKADSSVAEVAAAEEPEEEM